MIILYINHLHGSWLILALDRGVIWVADPSQLEPNLTFGWILTFIFNIWVEFELNFFNLKSI